MFRSHSRMGKLSDIEEQAVLLPKQQLTAVGQLQARLPARNSVAAWAGLVLCLWLLYPYLYCLTTAAYGVAYWLTRSPAVWAQPVPEGTLRNYTVPKIIHQTWKDHDIPEKWKAAQKSCLDLHPDWEYKLWTDADCLRFIEDHYPWFLPTYLAYPYHIQRVDAIRYFLLYHYGGVYIDLDMGCRKRLDFMRQYNFTAPLTHPGGISNDVLAAAPGATYLQRALGQLRRWNKFMLIKYIQVMFSTGPMFLTTQYALFWNKRDVAVVPAPMYGKYDKTGDPYFYHLHGSSWHANDAAFIFWLDKHKTLLIVLGLVLAVTLVCGYWVRCLMDMRKARRSE